MTHKERFLIALKAGGVPDRVPVAPDMSNYIPCKRTGLPFWDIYFKNEIPLWRAYLDAADYFDLDAWIASSNFVPINKNEHDIETKSDLVYDKDRDAMINKIEIMTPAGVMNQQILCYRYDPPSHIEKPIKNLVEDFPKYKYLKKETKSLNHAILQEMKSECEKRCQAFGLCIGYPGFQSWMNQVDGGVEVLTFAEYDTPSLLEEWYDIDFSNGTKLMHLLIEEAKPDYILFGGSGTITLASPQLAHKYAIPALKKWSAMAKAAGIPTMLHSCGKSKDLINMLVEETDVNSVNPLEIPPMGDVDLADAKKVFGDKIGLMGNLHTTDIMLNGTADDVRRAAKQAMEDAGQNGGFILSTGDQCGRDTPEENIFALVETAKEVGVYEQRTGRFVFDKTD
jgi:uroporphyrinogen decarboxylase